MSFLNELQRRNVLRVAFGYLAAAWLLIQIADTLFSMFEVPSVAGRVVVFVLAIGFVPVLVLSWVFEWTPEGLVSDTGADLPGKARRQRRFDRIVMILLAVAVAYFGFDKFILDPARDVAREREVAERARSEALVGSYGDRSIVVLPFVNMSAEASHEFFSDGITEELLNVLAAVPELRVISRSSSFAFKGKNVLTTEIAKQLNVSYVLEGSVRKAGQTVRITAQLIDARTDTHVWSDTYDREFALEKILAVQDEIAGLVVGELKVSLLDHEVHPVDPVAYEAELQVRYLLNLYEVDNVTKIEALIEQGLQANPDYAPLLWHKHRLAAHKVTFGLISREQAEVAQAGFRERLRELDPDNVNWLFLAAREETDLAEKARLAVKAYNMAPTDPWVVENVSRTARYVGQFDVAIALGEYLVDRDPLCGRCFFRLGLSYFSAMQLERAVAALEKAELLGTGGIESSHALGLAFLVMGEPGQALGAFSRISDEKIRAFDTLLAYHDLGDAAKYDELFPSIWQSSDWWQRAQIAAWTRDADTAFECLEFAYSESPDWFVELFDDILFMRVRDDARWHDWMRRAGTSEADLARIRMDIEV